MKLPRQLISIAEQGTQSIFGFIVVALSARLLLQNDFGMFSLFWGGGAIMIFLLNASLIKPFIMVFPDSDAINKEQQLVFFSKLESVLFVLSLILFCVSLLVWFLMEEYEYIVFILFGFSIMSSRVRYEIHRRVLLVCNEDFILIKDALLYYITSVLILFVVLFVKPYQINSLLSFICLLSLCMMLSQYLIKTSTNKYKHNHGNILVVIKDFWVYGKDLTISASVEVLFKRLSPYFMVVGAGVEEAGNWAVGKIITGPVQIILIGLSNSSLVQLREAYSCEGYEGLKVAFKKHISIMLVIYVLPIAVLFLSAEFLIEILIGVVYENSIETLRIYCVVFLVMGVSSSISILLNAMSHVRQQVYTSICSSLIYVVGTVYIVTNGIGAIGVASLSFFSELTNVIVFLLYLKYQCGNMQHA